MNLARPLKSQFSMLLLSVALIVVAVATSVSAQMMGEGHMRAMQPLMAWMQGADIDARPSAPAPAFNAQLHERGKLLYGQHCTICHGPGGDGNGRRASELSPRPRNFTLGVYEFHSTPTGALPTDEDIWKVISNGVHGSAMVPWISLPERDRWALVAYIEGFSPRFESEARRTPLTVPSPPPVTPALVAQGQQLFSDAGCVLCHGMEGHGDGASAPSLKTETGDPIRPPDFHDGIFRRGARLADIFLTLRTGLNGTPMPSYAGALTEEQTWALAAYVQSLGASPTESKTAIEAREQERMGLAIDMPGMAEMPMSGMMR